MSQIKKPKASITTFIVEREFLGKYSVKEAVKMMIKNHINRCHLSKVE